MSPGAVTDRSTYRGPRDRIMPRDQREAGIDHLGWEGRIRPRRSWISIIASSAYAAAGLAALLAIAFQGLAR